MLLLIEMDILGMGISSYSLHINWPRFIAYDLLLELFWEAFCLFLELGTKTKLIWLVSKAECFWHPKHQLSTCWRQDKNIQKHFELQFQKGWLVAHPIVYGSHQKTARKNTRNWPLSNPSGWSLFKCKLEAVWIRNSVHGNCTRVKVDGTAPMYWFCWWLAHGVLTLEYICLQFHNAKHVQQRSTGHARAGRWKRVPFPLKPISRQRLCAESVVQN